ncbi:hypothetical protein HDU76_008181 [Blyttiomyces sp. JEL0837]|nr:hypothetical protein HDU76_008181 [Blyttiomyces sp. JEL0837]
MSLYVHLFRMWGLAYTIEPLISRPPPSLKSSKPSPSPSPSPSPIPKKPLSPYLVLQIAFEIAAYGWACSSWTKGSLLLQYGTSSGVLAMWGLGMGVGGVATGGNDQQRRGGDNGQVQQVQQGDNPGANAAVQQQQQQQQQQRSSLLRYVLNNVTFGMYGNNNSATTNGNSFHDMRKVIRWCFGDLWKSSRDRLDRARRLWSGTGEVHVRSLGSIDTNGSTTGDFFVDGGVSNARDFNGWNEDDVRMVGAYYLFVAGLVFALMPRVVVVVGRKPESKPTYRGLILPTMLINVITTLIDEIAHVGLLSGVSSGQWFQIRGEAIEPLTITSSSSNENGTIQEQQHSTTPTDEDCAICLGAGLGPAEPDNETSSSNSSNLLGSGTSTSQDASSITTIPPPSNQKDPLERFCQVPNHVAHRGCMITWITSRRSWIRFILTIAEIRARSRRHQSVYGQLIESDELFVRDLLNQNNTAQNGMVRPCCPVCRGNLSRLSILPLYEGGEQNKKGFFSGVWGKVKGEVLEAFGNLKRSKGEVLVRGGVSGSVFCSPPVSRTCE